MIFDLRVLCRLVLLFFVAGCQTLPAPTEPYLVLVSVDGLGAGHHQAVDTPALDRLVAEGVRAERMRPVFPSMTFPNHYSIATGLYPHEHGIVDNTFPNEDRTDWYAISNRDAVSDGNWYSGEPIWVTAEKQGVVSAAYFFVGTEADIDGIQPTYWRSFDGSIPGAARVQQALDWLALPKPERPQLVTLYFEDVDNAGHNHGPGSDPWRQAIRSVDRFLSQLLDGIERLPIADNTYVLVVSDHGQALLRGDTPPFVIDEHVSLDGLEVIEHTSYVSLFMETFEQNRADNIASQINARWQQGRAYTRNNAPPHWQMTDDRRFADVIVVAEPGYAVFGRHNPERRLSKGNHGYDPARDEMQATFIARGPRLPAGKTLDLVHAVDLYPLMTAILQLQLPAGSAIQHDDLRQLLTH